MAQLKNLIVNGASRFLTPIKGDLSGTSDYSLKMETYKQGSSTETYGTSYPLWAQWETNNILKLLCTGYSTKVDLANTLATARTIRTNLASTSTASFDGSANITPGVTGTLPVGNGGTGKTTFTSGNAIIGNGTSAMSSSNLNISSYTATLAASDATAAQFIATNFYGSVALWASENRGVYDKTKGNWIIKRTQNGSETQIPQWASLGDSTKSVYFNGDGKAVASAYTICTLETAQTVAGAKTFSNNITVSKTSGPRLIVNNGTQSVWFGINTDGTDWGVYNATAGKYVIRQTANSTYIKDWVDIGDSMRPVYFNENGKPLPIDGRIYTAAECSSYTSDVGACTPAAVKKAVTHFGDDLYVSLTKSQTVTGNKTFNSAMYFGDVSVRPTTAATGYLGTADYPWSQMMARYIYSKYKGATYGYLRPYTEGTTSQIGNGRLTLGNETNEGTAGNARGSIALYGGGTSAAVITGYDGYIYITF